MANDSVQKYSRPPPLINTHLFELTLLTQIDSFWHLKWHIDLTEKDTIYVKENKFHMLS